MIYLTITMNDKHYTTAGKDLLEGEQKIVKKYVDRSDLITSSIAIAFSYIDKPVSLIENRLYSSALKQKIDRPIFIIGHFRTGTTFLEKVIAAHPQVGFIPLISYATPLSIIFLNWLIKSGIKMGTIKNIPKPAPHTGGTPMGLFDPAEVESIWRYCKRNPFAKKSASESDLLDYDFEDPAFEKIFKDTINKCLFVQKKTRFIHKNPVNGYRIGYLAKMFPNAKFIRTIRHPYLVVQSQLDTLNSLNIIIKNSKILKKLLSLCIDLPQVSSTKVDHGFKPLKTEEHMKIYEQDKALGVALMHVEYERTVDEMIRSNHLEKQFYSLKYEDFINNFSSESKNIFEFIDLYDEDGAACIEQQKNELLKGRKPQNLPPLSESVKAALRPLVNEYGYSETGAI